MTYLLVKALLSGLIVAAASEVARRWRGVGDQCRRRQIWGYNT